MDFVKQYRGLGRSFGEHRQQVKGKLIFSEINKVQVQDIHRGGIVQILVRHSKVKKKKSC